MKAMAKVCLLSIILGLGTFSLSSKASIASNQLTSQSTAINANQSEKTLALNQHAGYYRHHRFCKRFVYYKTFCHRRFCTWRHGYRVCYRAGCYTHPVYRVRCFWT